MEYRNNKIYSFRDLDAWKEAHKLALLIYKITKELPKDELFGLISQMRRAAISITSNIAEGFGRSSYSEKTQFYFVARGSLIELQNQIILSNDVGYFSLEDFNTLTPQTERVHKILNGLISKTKTFRK